MTPTPPRTTTTTERPRIIEVPVYIDRDIEVPVLRVVEKIIEIPVVQVVEKVIEKVVYEYLDREKIVEVPSVIFRDGVLPQQPPPPPTPREDCESRTDTDEKMIAETRGRYVQTEMYMVQMDALEQYVMVPHACLPGDLSPDRP